MKIDREALAYMKDRNRKASDASTSESNPGEPNTNEESLYARAKRLNQEAKQRRKQEEKDRVQKECQKVAKKIINGLSEGRLPVIEISDKARRRLEKKTPSFLRSQSPERIALLQSLAAYGVPENKVCIVYIIFFGRSWRIKIKP